MKKFALIIVVAGMSALSLAGPGPKTVACAVMTKNQVNIAAATKSKMFADYKGRRYFFCCDGCPQAFKKNPAKYSKAPSIPTPKAPAKKK